VTEPPPIAPRRLRLAQALAFVALLAALVGALGPAETVQTTYSWPPETLPREAPERLWYTPLLLVRHEPELLTSDVPCALPPRLPGAEEGDVLATARHPERVDGLAIREAGGGLVFSVGEAVLDSVALPDDASEGCAYRITISDGRWALSGGPDGIERGGELETMPTVTGLFSGYELRPGELPSIDVTTQVHATRTTTRQALAWFVAALGGLGALLLVSTTGWPRRLWARGSGSLRGAISSAGVADAVVGVALLGWLFLSPAYLDDGWVIARELMFESSRGFSNYYSNIGANLPLNYWHEWLEHWLVQATTSLPVLRLQALACLAVTWVCVRWLLARALGSVGASRTAVWSSACVFLVGAFAWGMTMRPEPLSAVLAVGVMVCAVWFSERGTVAPLATAAILLVLAVSSHHAGIVAFAPLIVIAPALLRWARSHFAVATTIVAATCALLATLLFVGSDLEQRRLDAQITRLYGATETWRDEIARYAFLSAEDYGTPLRRLSVALMGLVVLAFLLRVTRERRGLLDFPATVLTVGLALLVLTPSKWPSHFGALIGFAAVAFAAEAARLREEGVRAERWRAWPVIAVVVACAVAAWSWWTREQWNVIDLRTLDWHPAIEDVIPFAQLAALLPLVALGAVVAVGALRGRRELLPQAPWRVAAWTGPLLAVPLIVFTVAVLVADAAKTDGWTLTQQNLGRSTECGLADDVVVPTRSSVQPVFPSGPDTTQRPPWLPQLPAGAVEHVPRYVLGPAAARSTSTPWFELPPNQRFGLYVAGVPGPSDRLRLEWSHGRGGEVLQADDAGVEPDPLAGNTPWRFYAAGDLPAPPPNATLVRVTLARDALPGAAIAVSSPVTYSSEPLSNRVSRESSSLVLPNLFTYFPCARLPELHDGIVDAPQFVLVSPNPFSPIRYPISSPWAGLVDLYELERLSIADSENPPDELLVFERTEIPGAAIAPPMVTTVG
jgi:Mycobacterial cell wall arabinan synthesis protein